MDRDPGEFDKRDDVPARADGQASIDIGTIETRETIDAASAEARADRAAGRGVPHAEVAKWLATWGTPDYKPMPPEWLK